MALTIVASLAAAVSLSLGSRDAGAAEREARRLSSLMSLATDLALSRGEPLGLVLDATGYSFLRKDGGPLASAFDAHRWAEGLAPPRYDRARVDLDPDLADPWQISLRPRGGEGAVWQVRFDGFGAMAAPVEKQVAP